MIRRGQASLDEGHCNQTCWPTRIGLPSGSNTTKPAGLALFSSAFDVLDRQTSRVPALICHCDSVLDAGLDNLVAVAMVVCRRVFNPNEIATWFDRLTMSGCAPRNDSGPSTGSG